MRRVVERIRICVPSTRSLLAVWVALFALMLANAPLAVAACNSVLCADPNCAGCQAFLGRGRNSCHSCNSCNSSCDCAASAGRANGGYAMGEDAGVGLGDELLAEDYGTGYGYQSSAPNMIGDSLNG